MGVFAPAALGLLSLLGVVIALYMLRLRREEQRVPSILLWEALAEDPPANAPWQRLRWTPLLLLQLLALALLVLALARPWYWGNALTGDHLVLLVDRSASMAATDLGPSRLEVARETLLEMLDGAGDARVTLVAFDREMEVLTSAEADRAKVEAALAGLRPVPVVGDADDALAFADSLARDRDETRVVIFSDGGFDRDPELELAAEPRFVRIGEADDNQAITALSLEEAAGGTGLEAFVQVANAGRLAAERRLELLADGALVDARDLRLGPGERWSNTLALPASAERLEARFADADAYALDDRAWAVYRAPAELRVRLHSEGNRFLETALGLLPGVASVRVVEAGSDPLSAGRADLSVLDGGPPAGTALPEGGILLIGPTDSIGLGGSGAVEVVGRLEAPRPRVLDADHRLTRGLALDQISILEAAALELGSAWTPLLAADVEGRAWPLMARGEMDGRPALLLAFDLLSSDLPLRPAFPLLMAAAIESLAPGGQAGLPASARPGERLRFRWPEDAADPRILTPSGDRIAVEREGEGAGSAIATEPGIHRLVFDREGEETAIAFAVNAIQAEPIDLRARDPFGRGWDDADEPEAGGVDEPSARRAEAGEGAGSLDASRVEVSNERGRREIWWPLTLTVLGLLILEWAYDHRRGLREAWSNR